MEKQIIEKNKYIVKRVSITDTMRNMPFDTPVEYDALTCGSVSTVRSAITRLAQAGEGKWEVNSDNNGVTYTIIRHS